VGKISLTLILIRKGDKSSKKSFTMQKQPNNRFDAVPTLKFHSNNCAYQPQTALKFSNTNHMWESTGEVRRINPGCAT